MIWLMISQIEAKALGWSQDGLGVAAKICDQRIGASMALVRTYHSSENAQLSFACWNEPLG